MSLLPARTDRLTLVGVLNVTPDSFSDGGRFAGIDDAVAHGVAMQAQGADVVDVGGESTRPGATRVDASVESARVLPVIGELVAAGVTVSVDTYRAAVARDALSAGASIVNDVSGGLADPGMADVVKEFGCGWILMHWRGHSDTMQQLASYNNVVTDVRDELCQRVDAALRAGVREEQLAIDPGLGFAKTGQHNWDLLARLDEFVGIGLPVMIGASRKSFLGSLLADPDGAPRPADQRDDATAAITALCAQAGVWAVRVHSVPANVDTAKTIAAYVHAREEMTR